jgi:hypothetical protein
MTNFVLNIYRYIFYFINKKNIFYQYLLGVMLYFVVTNEFPFEGETTLKLLQNILNPKIDLQFTRI